MGGFTNLPLSATQEDFMFMTSTSCYSKTNTDYLSYCPDETDALSFNSITQVHPEPTLHRNQFGRALCPRGCITIGL